MRPWPDTSGDEHNFREAWTDTAGPTVILAERGNGVAGWFEHAAARDGFELAPA